jgi:hypothetical protein
MKNLSLLLTVICISSISLVFSQKPVEKGYPSFDDFLKEQKALVDNIEVGMTLDEVKQIMGPQVVVKVPKTGKIKALRYTFKQPEYANEFMKNTKNHKTILWYFYEPRDQNGMITKRECSPVIFEDNQVIGKGWEYFNQLRKKGFN